jgi:hypothetical protein
MASYKRVIDPFIFMIAFSLGICYTYVTHNPDKKNIIIKYPTNINTPNATYRDTAGTCYTYSVIPETCPVNKKDVFVVPVQENRNVHVEKRVISAPQRLYNRFF